MSQQVESAEKNKERIENYLKLEISLGSREYYRGILKSCFNLIGAMDPSIILDSAFDECRLFIFEDKGDSEKFIRWSDTKELEIPKIGIADHFLCVTSRESTVEGMVVFFNCVVHSFKLANTYSGKQFRYGYLVDPFRQVTPAEIRNPEFDLKVIPDFQNQPSSTSQAVSELFQTRLKEVLSAAGV